MPWLIINTYVSLMYELKKIGKVFTSRFVGNRALVLWKNNLPGRGLTKVDKHWPSEYVPRENLAETLKVGYIITYIYHTKEEYFKHAQRAFVVS